MTVPDGFIKLEASDRTNLGLNLGMSLNELSAFANPGLDLPIMGSSVFRFGEFHAGSCTAGKSWRIL